MTEDKIKKQNEEQLNDEQLDDVSGGVENAQAARIPW